MNAVVAETGPHYIPQANLELMTLLPQIPKSWD